MISKFFFILIFCLCAHKCSVIDRLPVPKNQWTHLEYDLRKATIKLSTENRKFDNLRFKEINSIHFALSGMELKLYVIDALFIEINTFTKCLINYNIQYHGPVMKIFHFNCDEKRTGTTQMNAKL